MIKNLTYSLLLLMICIGSLSSQIDLSVQYEKMFSQADGDVIGLVIDAPVKSISIGVGIHYAFLGDYRYVPVISLNPDGTIGKGHGFGFHLNSKYYFTDTRAWFIEPSFNISFINQDDNRDVGIFTPERDQSYSVIKPLLSVGYVIGKSTGLLVALKSGTGVQYYSNIGESHSQHVFQLSLQLGYRFYKKTEL